MTNARSIRAGWAVSTGESSQVKRIYWQMSGKFCFATLREEEKGEGKKEKWGKGVREEVIKMFLHGWSGSICT